MPDESFPWPYPDEWAIGIACASVGLVFGTFALLLYLQRRGQKAYKVQCDKPACDVIEGPNERRASKSSERYLLRSRRDREQMVTSLKKVRRDDRH